MNRRAGEDLFRDRSVIRMDFVRCWTTFPRPPTARRRRARKRHANCHVSGNLCNSPELCKLRNREDRCSRRQFSFECDEIDDPRVSRVSANRSTEEQVNRDQRLTRSEKSGPTEIKVKGRPLTLASLYANNREATTFRNHE